MTAILISCLFMFLAGLFNSCMDVLKYRFDQSVFKRLNADFWDPEISWMNKYDTFWVDEKRFITYMPDGSIKERFFLSTTMFVFVTDGWHLCKALMFFCIEIAITVPALYWLDVAWWYWLVVPLLLAVSRSVAFNLFYERVLVWKK